MHIGLIGGIGPAATETYYRTLVRIYGAAGLRLSLTIAHADVQEMTANLAAGRAEEQAAIFAGYIDRLRAGGCEIAAVTSMGGHFCRAELVSRSSLPLVDAIPAIDAHFAGLGIRRIGVMGTHTVMESRFYGLPSVEVIIPPPDDLAAVHDAYIAIAKSGTATPGQGDYFRAMGRRLRDMGADVVVLGGTDLSPAFAGHHVDYPVADSAVIHSEAIARVAMNG